jgi:hypothetical protein
MMWSTLLSKETHQYNAQNSVKQHRCPALIPDPRLGTQAYLYGFRNERKQIEYSIRRRSNNMFLGTMVYLLALGRIHLCRGFQTTPTEACTCRLRPELHRMFGFRGGMCSRMTVTALLMAVTAFVALIHGAKADGVFSFHVS